MKVQSLCRVCGIIDDFEVPDKEMQARRRGIPMVLAYASQAKERIRQLMDNICPACQGLEEAVDADQAVPKL